MNETSPLSPQHLSLSVSLSFSPSASPFLFCFSSILMHPLPNLTVRREAIENLVERVFMVDSVVRWLSQRRMLIRQPRLRLIWLAAVTPSSCSQSVPPPLPSTPLLHCLLSVILFLFSIFFFLSHTGPPLQLLALSFLHMKSWSILSFTLSLGDPSHSERMTWGC